MGVVVMCQKCGYSRSPTPAEHLLATARDRRLETAICNGLEQPPCTESAPGRKEGVTRRATETELVERGGRIARFLIEEYSVTTHRQREFFVELAAELVQRIDEDMPGATEVRDRRAPLNAPRENTIRRLRMSLGLFSRFIGVRVKPRRTGSLPGTFE
jgi:hypothetical protein